MLLLNLKHSIKRSINQLSSATKTELKDAYFSLRWTNATLNASPMIALRLRVLK